jgi:hypothetical protein
MLQQMAKQHAELWAAVDAVAKDPRVRDGNPRAQAKLEAKIKNLGALQTDLKPGKRGRYELHIYSLPGWDPQRDTLIEPDDPIPEKPQICTLFHVVRGEGHGRVRHTSFIWLYLTHHCLSRSGQRWGVRTVTDLSVVIEKTIRVAIEYLTLRGLADMATGGDAWLDTPPAGVRLPMPGSDTVIVVKKHETRDALVVATVLLAENSQPMKLSASITIMYDGWLLEQNRVTEQTFTSTMDNYDRRYADANARKELLAAALAGQDAVVGIRGRELRHCDTILIRT